MHQGNWTCSGCGGEIKELPFEPKSTTGLLCRTCHAKKGGNGGGNRPNPEKQKFSGNWSCSGCGTDIKELPFQPRETGNLLCVNCFKQSRA